MAEMNNRVTSTFFKPYKVTTTAKQNPKKMIILRQFYKNINFEGMILQFPSESNVLPDRYALENKNSIEMQNHIRGIQKN